MSIRKGARHGEPMAIMILIFMSLFMMYWLSGLSGVSPITNSTAAGFFTPVYNNAKGFIAMFASMCLMFIVKAFSMNWGDRKQRVVEIVE